MIQPIQRKTKARAKAKLRFAAAVALSLAISLFAGARLSAAEITVFAAASLTDSLKEIACNYEKKNGDKIIFNFGASSFLARQIREGAPADIFFSADEARMDDLERDGLVLKDTRRSLLSNSLVIIVAADNGAAVSNPKDLATEKVKKLALAEPAAVPAGIYAKEYLQGQQLWAAVESKVVPTENVRAALAAVEAGNVEAGIVYKTDAAISKKVKVAYEVPLQDSPKISYPAAVARESKQLHRSRKFLDYLSSAGAKKVFHKYGFVIPEPEESGGLENVK